MLLVELSHSQERSWCRVNSAYKRLIEHIDELKRELAQVRAEITKLQNELEFRKKTGGLFSEMMNEQVAGVIRRDEYIEQLEKELSSWKIRNAENVLKWDKCVDELAASQALAKKYREALEKIFGLYEGAPKCLGQRIARAALDGGEMAGK